MQEISSDSRIHKLSTEFDLSAGYQLLSIFALYIHILGLPDIDFGTFSVC